MGARIRGVKPRRWRQDGRAQLAAVHCLAQLSGDLRSKLRAGLDAAQERRREALLHQLRVERERSIKPRCRDTWKGLIETSIRCRDASWVNEPRGRSEWESIVNSLIGA